MLSNLRSMCCTLNASDGGGEVGGGGCKEGEDTAVRRRRLDVGDERLGDEMLSPDWSPSLRMFALDRAESVELARRSSMFFRRFVVSHPLSRSGQHHTHARAFFEKRESSSSPTLELYSRNPKDPLSLRKAF